MLDIDLVGAGVCLIDWIVGGAGLADGMVLRLEVLRDG
jgi:hypothetical protein